MKALKEKRIGFRSLLRRGLVILSLFALIFAVACGGNDGGSTTPDPDPDPDPDPEVPAVTVTRLIVTDHPTAISFQGLAPDLTGLKGVIVWSDGTREDIAIANMVSDPPFCDYVTPNNTITEDWDHDGDSGTPDIKRNKLSLQDGSYSVYVKDHPELKAPVVLPLVVPYYNNGTVVDTTKFVFEDEITGEWYSDEIPNFDAFSITATYADYVSDASKGTVAASVTKTIPVTGAYPPLISITNTSLDAHEDPVLTFGLGFDPTQSLSPLIRTAYQEPVDVTHSGYIRASGITVNAASITGNYFDDDADLVLDTVDAAEDQTRIMGILEDAGVTLTVNYYGKEEPRTKTIAELMTAIDFYNSFLGTNTIDYVARTGQIGTDGVLATREDEETYLPYFPVTLNYVPVIWGSAQGHTGADAWVDQFDVRLPVYTFLDAYASRKANTGTNNVTVIEEAGYANDTTTQVAVGTLNTDKGYNLLAGLQSKWELIGTYERGTAEQLTRPIPLTANMFANGITTGTRPMPSYTPGTTPVFTLNGGAQGYDWSVAQPTLPTPPNANLAANAVGYNYVLPIWYRGVELSDAEMGVVVDLIGQ